MNSRLWYPQLDVYDAVRRLGSLITTYPTPPGIERLYIADFYLANPPLLHLSRMTKGVRQTFHTLRIPHPKKTFLTYPEPPLLFKKMEPIQKEAIRAMAGKGLLSIMDLHRGYGKLTESGQAMFTTILADGLSQQEVRLIRFLTTDFAVRVDAGTRHLRQSTGLRGSRCNTVYLRSWATFGLHSCRRRDSGPRCRTLYLLIFLLTPRGFT